MNCMVNIKENFKFDLGGKGLTPRIDRHPISPNNIIGKSNTKVVKIKEIIGSKRSSPYLHKIFLSVRFVYFLFPPFQQVQPFK